MPVDLVGQLDGQSIGHDYQIASRHAQDVSALPSGEARRDRSLGHTWLVPSYRDTGVVLRAVKLGEADRIVTILTREHGCVRAVARGVRRTSSRIGARLEPGSHVDVQCHTGRSLDSVTQVESLANYGALLAVDYRRWTVGQAMVETAERLTGEDGQATGQHYLLLVGGLRTLSEGERDPGLILDSYLLRALALSGWAPSFVDCAGCGRPGPHPFFHVSHGGCLCVDCRASGSVRPGLGVLELMGALLTGDWERAEASEPADRRTAAGLTAAYLQWHLERRVRALAHVERHL